MQSELRLSPLRHCSLSAGPSSAAFRCRSRVLRLSRECGSMYRPTIVLTGLTSRAFLGTQCGLTIQAVLGVGLARASGTALPLDPGVVPGPATMAGLTMHNGTALVASRALLSKAGMASITRVSRQPKRRLERAASFNWNEQFKCCGAEAVCGPRQRFAEVAISPLSGDKQRSGNRAAMDARDLKRTFRQADQATKKEADAKRHGSIRRRRNNGARRDSRACTSPATSSRAGRSFEASIRRAQRSSAAPASDTSNKASWLPCDR